MPYVSEYTRDRGHSCKKSDQGMGKEFIAGEGGIDQGTFVMFSGADDITILPCTANGPIIGVAMDTADAGDTVEVQMDGYHWIMIETVSDLVPGDWLVAGAALGYADKFTCPAAGNETTMGGYILSTPVESGDCICMKVQLKKACSIQRG